jgi:hypothetical protein
MILAFIAGFTCSIFVAFGAAIVWIWRQDCYWVQVDNDPNKPILFVEKQSELPRAYVRRLRRGRADISRAQERSR